MTSPMPDHVPAHRLIPVNAAGEGPVDFPEIDHFSCWCSAGDECLEWLDTNPPMWRDRRPDLQ
jgi:hypothetical protein